MSVVARISSGRDRLSLGKSARCKIMRDGDVVHQNKLLKLVGAGRGGVGGTVAKDTALGRCIADKPIGIYQYDAVCSKCGPVTMTVEILAIS